MSIILKKDIQKNQLDDKKLQLLTNKFFKKFNNYLKTKKNLEPLKESNRIKMGIKRALKFWYQNAQNITIKNYKFIEPKTKSQFQKMVNETFNDIVWYSAIPSLIENDEYFNEVKKGNFHKLSLKY